MDNYNWQDTPGKTKTHSYSPGKNPTGKRPIGISKMRWEDVVKKNVEELGGGSDWKACTTDREGWKVECMMGWS
ncbi:Reverse transcriptase domain-containing protein [Aphis craccivora]|uniref:Reverse transcriptase domain-containing protein n=1 Tax=Aphis craccivora TaxID=307492 RepID=A0A6G0ZB24_APHCR|nr:Reverse transcriptase domain-containing protein [Aphis craccivora]